jgi:hypothetical protein
MTDYRWLAESVVITGDTVAKDLRAALRHALDVPGEITPAQAGRLAKLLDRLEAAMAGGR